MSRSTDLAYGRRGGRIVAGKRLDIDRCPRCAVCDLPMVAGQRGRHLTCSPPCIECGAPVDTAEPRDHRHAGAKP